MLFYNTRVYTQAGDVVTDSIAISGNHIVALGNGLEHDPDFRSYARVNLKGKVIVPGLVDAHTHFYYWALSLGRVQLDGLTSLDACLKRIAAFAAQQPKGSWIVGDGYAPDRFTNRTEPDRYQLDNVTGGRPAFIFSKDQHSAWVNSRALEAAGIGKSTPDPEGGRIERLADGTPTGILRESSGYGMIWKKIPPVDRRDADKRFEQALDLAYRKGVTGVHSMDGPQAFEYLLDRASRANFGLRINYYASGDLLPQLQKERIYFGTGTEFFRIAGVKLFADGSLGSQTALCYRKYVGSRNNYGIETMTVPEMKQTIKSAARLGLPCAIHAIGDKAVGNVLDAFESAPKLHFGARHRIEHMQLIRRSDITRLKRLGIVGSMQPSHCPSDIPLIRKYWGKRGADAFIFRTLIDRGIDLAFGSDAPIEPLDPIAGIAAAVRRARPGSRDALYPEQRITVEEALFRFTVGPAIACGQEHCRGYLLPGYPADLVILDQDITRTPPTRLYDVGVLGTMLDGNFVFADKSLKM
ncbi:hypothetical protein C3F09_11875 [candidate division GN15 bacterium]|uniref:Amidohydrolase 3 domain-containing protein n=1 Tax=candidate division GN15 bacterium TaxID=2072418 RepID=A0A855X3B9_9BACT|nr:MAG: hypothetical protein C3F09_11875 [candidate division GN15 bacterium]